MTTIIQFSHGDMAMATDMSKKVAAGGLIRSPELSELKNPLAAEPATEALAPAKVEQKQEPTKTAAKKTAPK